jgi:tetratricopeptide (TPR) repeat protein
MEAGDLEEVDTHLPKVVEAATAAGDPGLQWAATFIRAFRSLLAGRLEEAESLARQALQIGTDIGFPEATPTFVFQLFEIRRQQDRLAELETTFAQAADEHPGFPMLQAAWAEICCDAGNYTKARELLANGGPKFCADYDYEAIGWTCGATAYADVCAQVADIEMAGRLYERLAPWHDHVTFVPGVITRGTVSHYLGMLATALTRYEAAEAHFDEAMRIHQRVQAPFWIARTQLERARLLMARDAADDQDQAGELLDEVDAAAAEFGFAALERHAAVLRP